MTASRDTYFWGWCLWIALAAVRIALVTVPQTGYIHPDEFFQSTEVAAGDIFGLKVRRTWEFTSVHPIRSAAIIYLTSGIPLLILKCIAHCVAGPGTTPSPYWLLVAPRLFACLASFICDYTVYHLSASPAKQHRRLRALQLFASSYVALVFYTRTFSNSVESLLLALLLLCVKNVLQDDKLKLNDGQLKISRRYTAIGALITLGMFNRPTFVCFALPAIAFWLFSRIERSVKTRKHRTYAQMAQQLAKRASRLASRCLCFCAFLVAADTYYFCPEALSGKALQDPSSLQHLVVTPLNFIRYNLNSTNLKSHGEHPHFLHLIVNVPLLFNILGIAALWVSVKILYRRLPFISKLDENHETFTVCKLFDLVTSCTVLLPLFALSLVKHQEPRFLTPLLVPMVLVAHRSFSKKLLVVWALANMVCLAFFGFFHQGGLVPCMLHMQQRIAAHKEEGANATVIFAQTYMPPQHLLTVRQDDATVKFYDMLSGAAVQHSGIAYLGSRSNAYWKYLFAPPSFKDARPEWFQDRLVEQFSCDFHFSGEHLPQFSYADLANGAVSLTDLRKAFSLTVYWVNFPGKPGV